MADCIVEKENMGITQCNKLPGMIRGMITTPAGFKLSSANALDQQQWQDALLAIKSARIYLWPFFVGVEDISEEAVYEETPLAYLQVRDGNYRYKFHVKENLCIHKAMYSHRAAQGRAFLIDDQNQIIGTQNEAGEFMGFSIQLLNTEKMKFSDGAVSTKSPVVLALRNNKEFDKEGAIVSADFIDDLLRIVDAELTIVGNPSATTIVVDVKVKCDGTPINGLVLADFVLKNAAGNSVAINTVTESDGRYTLSGVSFVTGTLTLKPPATLSIKAYEANVATITVS